MWVFKGHIKKIPSDFLHNFFSLLVTVFSFAGEMTVDASYFSVKSGY